MTQSVSNPSYSEGLQIMQPWRQDEIYTLSSSPAYELNVVVTVAWPLPFDLPPVVPNAECLRRARHHLCLGATRRVHSTTMP